MERQQVRRQATKEGPQIQLENNDGDRVTSPFDMELIFGR
jgi:hypothetical protein